MANRSKSTSQSRKTSGRSSSTTRKRRTTKKKQPTAFALSLRPEHQRELFALALLLIAVVTLIFFFTGTTGIAGEIYLQGMTGLFGAGALMIPLALGGLGLAIMVQERLRDTPLTGTNILGVLLLLGVLLAFLEIPSHTVPLEQRASEGGGLAGYWLVNLFDAAIGRPATVLVLIGLVVTGLLLTFNLTLYQLVNSSAAGLNHLITLAFQGSEPRRPTKPATNKTNGETLAYEAPPQGGATKNAATEADNDIVPTPIAARPTRASLFKRNTTAESAQASPFGEAEPAAKKNTSEGETDSKPVVPVPTKPTVETAAPSRSPATKPEKPAVPAPAASGGNIQENLQTALEGFDVPAVYRAWPLPVLDLLDAPVEGSISDDERRTRSRLIEETLASFKVEAQVVGVNTGPAVTQFEVQPAVGVKISKITSLERDLALALAAKSIRIEAPIPGKSVVGIEIPNTATSVVSLREVIDSEEFEATKGRLKLPLGKDVSGNPVVADMTRMPHLLVAGSTGSGKSVAINTFLCGLLLKHTPETLKLIMVDPKMVELIVYNRIPHLLSPVVTELERVVPTLKWATREMERRYKIFARHACRNLDSYRKLAQHRADLEPMPYILIVIDELADLMMLAPDEIETYICRLAQMARATGIHLIIATQRPSVDVITGLIKANFPSRMAFAVSSQVDSRVILDTPGADQLLGRGDMLYMAADAAKLVRIQGTFVSDREVEQIVDFWRSAKPPGDTEGSKPPSPSDSNAVTTQGNGSAAQSQPTTTPAMAATAQTSTPAQDANRAMGPSEQQLQGDELDTEPIAAFEPPAAFLSATEQDTLLPQALELVKQHRRASASLLQRRLRIGYSKAAQLIDLLEQQGVVGPAEGGRSREVLQRDSLEA